MNNETTHLYQSIHAQPTMVRTLLNDWQGADAAAQQLSSARRIFLAGTGTSYHAACIGEYLLRLAGADAWAVRLFEFVTYPRPLHKDDAIILISHRGSKRYGIQALQLAQQQQIVTIGITGKHSKMQDASITVETVEQEISSTHSISYTAALTRLGQIATRVASHHGHAEQARRLEDGLTRIPRMMEAILARQHEVREIAHESVSPKRRIYYIGAGPNAATATEGALKAKEAAYVTAEGLELEQAIHGPEVAFESHDLIVPICVPGPAQARMGEFLSSLQEIGPRLWLVGEAPNQEILSAPEASEWKQFRLTNGEELSEVLTPLVAALPVQLLAESLAAQQRTNADSFRKDQEPYRRAYERVPL